VVVKLRKHRNGGRGEEEREGEESERRRDLKSRQ